MMKAIIIEDEVNIREGLKKMIKHTSNKLEIVGETAYVNEAVELIKKQKPDIIFLDIELEDGNGFDLLHQIDEENAPKVIFTTAYNQYAIKAFKFNAIDYLLKPIDIEELEVAINNASTVILNEKQYENLLGMYHDSIEKPQQKIILKTTQNQYIIKLSDIISIEADGSYSHFYTTEQKITISKNLKYYQDLLDESTFVRCHHSHLVNLNHVKTIEKGEKFILTNDHSIPISKRKKAEILSIVNNAKHL